MRVMGPIMVAGMAALLLAGAFLLAGMLEDEDFELDEELADDAAGA